MKARWGIGRMRYTVDPGLYALGRPGRESAVFVTANYKMSFDLLRASLKGLDAWILVLDTLGINVWCAAGKGTFGTEELVGRIESSGLGQVVSHRRLILPQLGAPGVAAHEVAARSGFRVVYGPVSCRDIPAFLERGLKATPAMREKRFRLAERLALVPMEVVPAMKAAIPAAAFLSVIAFFASGLALSASGGAIMVACLALAASVLAGAVLTPLLLPWLPGRAFSTKGLSVGAAAALAAAFLAGGSGIPAVLALLFSVPAMAAYLAMNFTGSSTFTSLSGVKKEMRWALPMEIGGTVVGLAFWVAVLIGGRP